MLWNKIWLLVLQVEDNMLLFKIADVYINYMMNMLIGDIDSHVILYKVGKQTSSKLALFQQIVRKFWLWNTIWNKKHVKLQYNIQALLLFHKIMHFAHHHMIRTY